MAKNTTAKVSLGLAVQTRNFDMIKTVVENAIKIVTDAEIKSTNVTVPENAAEAVALVTAAFKAPQPAVPSIETVHGAMPLTSIFDEDTIWLQIEAEYAKLTQTIQRLPEEGRTLAVAKLIAANAVLRNCTEEATATVDGLI